MEKMKEEREGVRGGDRKDRKKRKMETFKEGRRQKGGERKEAGREKNFLFY